jgi:protein phosphatase
VGIVDLRALLTEAGYNVVFRTAEWTDCFVSDSSEKWHGYGLSEDDALRDTLRKMIPSNLGRFLLEHEMAHEVAPDPGLDSLTPSSPPSPTAAPAPSAHGLDSPVPAPRAVAPPSPTLVSHGLGHNGAHAPLPLTETGAPDAMAERLSGLIVPDPDGAWPTVDTATRAAGLLGLNADLESRSADLDIREGTSPLACEPDLPVAVMARIIVPNVQASETPTPTPTTESPGTPDVEHASGLDPGDETAVGGGHGEPPTASPRAAEPMDGAAKEPADERAPEIGDLRSTRDAAEGTGEQSTQATGEATAAATVTPAQSSTTRDATQTAAIRDGAPAEETHQGPQEATASGETPEDVASSKKAGRARASGGAAKVAAAGDTQCGVLHSKNDDAFAVLRDHGLFVVADGLEANAAGDVASRMAIEVIQKTFETRTAAPASRQGLPFLVAAIQRANAKVFGAGRQDPKLRGMGTTIAAALTLGKRVALAHIGDSRIYRLRGGVLELLTTDHSVVNEQIRLGEQADLRATGAPRAQLTRALGTRPSVETDTSVVAVRPGDTLLLCTDGVHALLKHEALTEILSKGGAPEGLVAQVLERVSAAGRPDNTTAVVVRWDGSETS